MFGEKLSCHFMTSIDDVSLTLTVTLHILKLSTHTMAGVIPGWMTVFRATWVTCQGITLGPTTDTKPMEEQITSAAGHRGTHELWVFWHREPAKPRPDAERHGFATQWHGVFKDGEISNVFLSFNITSHILPHFLLVFYGISQARWPRYSPKWRKRTNPVMPTLLQSDVKHQPKRKSLKIIPKKIEKSRQVRCKKFIIV